VRDPRRRPSRAASSFVTAMERLANRMAVDAGIGERGLAEPMSGGRRCVSGEYAYEGDR
jgi:hypothetical protein